MFLWVSLVVKDILRKYDEGQGVRSLMKHLDSVPRALEDLFCQLLTTGPFSTMVVKMFQWALLPARPLRLQEWHHILAFIGDTTPSSLHQWRESDVYTETDEQLEKRITHLSRGLLGFNARHSDSHEPADDSRSDCAGAGSLDLSTGESRVVQVIHESVRQYFMEGPGFAVVNPAFAEKPLAHSHLSMMSVCLNYILIDELDALVEARLRAQRHTEFRVVPNETVPRADRPASVASFGSASSHDGRQTPVQPEKRQEETQREDTLRGSTKRPSLDGSLTSTSLPKGMHGDLSAFHDLKSLSGSAEAYDVTSSWLKDQSKTTDQGYCDAKAAHPSPRASVTGCSQTLEDHPALLSYATFELLTHARKVDEENLDPGDIIWLFLRTDTWRRWKVLREDIDEQIELLYFAADLGLSSWLNVRGIWRKSEVTASIKFAIDNDNTEVLSRLLDTFPSAGYAEGFSGGIIHSLVSVPDAALLQAYLSSHPSQKHSSKDCTMAMKDMLSSKDEAGSTALHLAVIHQNEAAVSVLLENGADVSVANAVLSTPLHLACMNESRLAFMFSRNKSFDVEILTPSRHIIEMLLKYNAEVDALDAHGRTPLFVACSNITLPSRRDAIGTLSGTKERLDRGDPNVVDLLLKHGANVHTRSSLGLLPLHEACKTSSSGPHSMVSIVSKLLDYGSPVNAGSKDGTPLHVACCYSDARIVQELLRRGADPLLRDYAGESALHVAVRRSTEQVVAALLSFPGNLVDATDNSGLTPLHLACCVASEMYLYEPTKLSTIGHLLARGARAYTLRNGDGDTPADIAMYLGSEKVLKMLAEGSRDAPHRGSF